MNWKRIFKLLLTLFLIWFIGHTVFITVDGLSDNGKNADVAVILGNKVNEDGTLSERLKKRLECGLSLYQNHRIKKIIVSGGLGKEGFFEGNKMRAFLVANKVPDSLIIVDNFGNNTRATVNNTMKLKDSLHFKSIIVVSQYFHVTRTKMLFKKQGFQNVSSASPNYFEIKDVYSIIREFAGYYTQ
ncbi:YdcF family protein [Flavobacterium sp. MR2016-29]|uniref:YdcF family protein n=1 Tax=Flavobacterium sp. MR2016-29 TaxID=2783795 RepID=UPI00188CD1E2|nr:YdcF family protein [Flavobacterium sp. MR2016-29]MBF4491899.1 YdcF family protein [Flavobacterium sp. MR2016-29]